MGARGKGKTFFPVKKAERRLRYNCGFPFGEPQEKWVCFVRRVPVRATRRHSPAGATRPFPRNRLHPLSETGPYRMQSMRPVMMRRRAIQRKGVTFSLRKMKPSRALRGRLSWRKAWTKLTLVT